MSHITFVWAKRWHLNTLQRPQLWTVDSLYILCPPVLQQLLIENTPDMKLQTALVLSGPWSFSSVLGSYSQSWTANQQEMFATRNIKDNCTVSILSCDIVHSLSLIISKPMGGSQNTRTKRHAVKPQPACTFPWPTDPWSSSCETPLHNYIAQFCINKVN